MRRTVNSTPSCQFCLEEKQTRKWHSWPVGKHGWLIWDLEGARWRDWRYRNLKGHVAITTCVDRKCSLFGPHIGAHKRIHHLGGTGQSGVWGNSSRLPPQVPPCFHERPYTKQPWWQGPRLWVEPAACTFTHHSCLYWRCPNMEISLIKTLKASWFKVGDHNVGCMSWRE